MNLTGLGTSLGRRTASRKPRRGVRTPLDSRTRRPPPGIPRRSRPVLPTAVGEKVGVTEVSRPLPARGEVLFDGDDSVDGYRSTAEQFTDADSRACLVRLVEVLLVGPVHLPVRIHLGEVRGELGVSLVPDRVGFRDPVDAVRVDGRAAHRSRFDHPPPGVVLRRRGIGVASVLPVSADEPRPGPPFPAGRTGSTRL